MAKTHCLACHSYYESSEAAQHDTPCAKCRYSDHPACCCAKTNVELDKERNGK